MTYFAGLDLSLEETSVCVLDGNGAVVREAKVSTDPDAIASWLHESGYSASKLGFEAGALSTWLFHELTTRGWDVVCLETRQVHQVLKAHRDKTDRGDAVGIAQLLRSGWYQSVHIKSYEAHASRALLKARVELVRVRQDLENTIRGLLKPFGIRLPRGDRRTLAVRVRTSCAARPALAAATEALLQAREPVMAEIDKLETLLISIARRDETCRRLMTVPGVGPIVALAFLSSVDDGRRFPKAREVGAYFGLTPRRHQSGEIDYQGRISKRGDRMVRTLLYEAATVLLTIVKRFSSLKSWGLRLAKRIGFKRACIALARKLAVVLTCIIKDGTEFWWSDRGATA